jgi:hypothetical protein
METVLQKLQQWKDELNDSIQKLSDKEKIELKKEIERAIYGIEFCLRYNISKSTIASIISLPESNLGYSEYRILDDCEVDERSMWKEIERANAKDIVIKFK